MSQVESFADWLQPPLDRQIVEDRVYSYARTVVPPQVRLRFFGLAQQDHAKDFVWSVFEVDVEPGLVVVGVPLGAVWR